MATTVDNDPGTCVRGSTFNNECFRNMLHRVLKGFPFVTLGRRTRLIKCIYFQALILVLNSYRTPTTRRLASILRAVSKVGERGGKPTVGGTRPFFI